MIPALSLKIRIMQRRNKTFRILVIALSLVFLFGTAGAQSNFLPGYIIDAQGELVSGWIDYRDWSKNPKVIAFKMNENERAINLTPVQIRAFSVQDEKYESAIVSTCIDPVATNSLTRFPELTQVKDTVFLNVVVLGEKSLFHAKNEHNIDNFYIERGDSLELLMYKKYLKQDERGYRVAEMKYFVSQLQSYLGDCQSLSADIAATKYNFKSITALFETYQACAGNDAEHPKDSKKIVTLEFGASAGAVQTWQRFRSAEPVFHFLTLADFQRSRNPTFGLYFDAIQNKRGRNWALSNDILYTSFRINGRYTEVRSEQHYIIHTTQFAYSHIKLSHMLRYRIPIRDVRIFVNGGLSYGFLLKEYNHRAQELFFFSTERTSEDRPIENPLKLDPGFVYGAGAQAGRFTVEIRGEQSSGISRIIKLSAPTLRTFLLVKYHF